MSVQIFLGKKKISLKLYVIKRLCSVELSIIDIPSYSKINHYILFLRLDIIVRLFHISKILFGQR
jgi:hypothetical protein